MSHSYVRDIYYATRNSTMPNVQNGTAIPTTRVTRATHVDDVPGSEETPLLREARYVRALSLESLCSVRMLRILLIGLLSVLFAFILLLLIPATRSKILHDGAELGLQMVTLL